MESQTDACSWIRNGERGNCHETVRVRVGMRPPENQVQKENATEGGATKDMGSSAKTRGSKQNGRRDRSITQESDRLNTAEQAGIRTPRSLRDSRQVRRVPLGGQRWLGMPERQIEETWLNSQEEAGKLVPGRSPPGHSVTAPVANSALFLRLSRCPSRGCIYVSYPETEEEQEEDSPKGLCIKRSSGGCLSNSICHPQ